MEAIFNLNWSDIFAIRTPVLEIFLRGTIVYLFLFFLLRVVLRREAGTVGITDLLVIVLLADASQNAMAGGYKSVPEGLILVSTIVGWSHLLEWLGYRFQWIERWIHPPALPLVKNGQMHRRNMRHELITEEELISQIRLQGVDDLSQVKKAYMESDGRISVITQQPRKKKDAPEKRGM